MYDNAYEDLKTKENKNHIFNLSNILKMNGVFRTCSHNSVHSNFLDYHKQPDTFMHILNDEHFI